MSSPPLLTSYPSRVTPQGRYGGGGGDPAAGPQQEGISLANYNSQHALLLPALSASLLPPSPMHAGGCSLSPFLPSIPLGATATPGGQCTTASLPQPQHPGVETPSSGGGHSSFSPPSSTNRSDPHTPYLTMGGHLCKELQCRHARNCGAHVQGAVVQVCKEP